MIYGERREKGEGLAPILKTHEIKIDIFDNCNDKPKVLQILHEKVYFYNGNI